MSRFIVIGIDDNPQHFFTPEILRVIQAGTVFSGGKRHYELVAALLPASHQWIDITVPLESVFKAYSAFPEIIVFASGDPLFYGFANTLKRNYPEAALVVYPVFNSLQTLAHRLVMPYQDMRIVSLTGRPWHALDCALIEQAKHIGLLTDREHTPDAIAAYLLDYGYSQYKMAVGEHLGNPELERVRIFTLEAAQRHTFDLPNCVMLMQSEPFPKRCFGIPDAEFECLDGRTKMITKMPVRLLTLQALQPANSHHFWDVGFCTGSVSIEAKLQFPHLHIRAFEIREAGRALMETNSRRFRAPGIVYSIGDFCDQDLSGLEKPDAVFIGGHGGNLKRIVHKIAGCLSDNGSLVFNAVSEASLLLFRQAVAENEMQLVQQTAVTIDSFNTITICRAVRL